VVRRALAAAGIEADAVDRFGDALGAAARSTKQVAKKAGIRPDA